jgi:hypothetical protein
MAVRWMRPATSRGRARSGTASDVVDLVGEIARGGSGRFRECVPHRVGHSSRYGDSGWTRHRRQSASAAIGDAGDGRNTAWLEYGTPRFAGARPCPIRGQPNKEEQLLPEAGVYPHPHNASLVVISRHSAMPARALRITTVAMHPCRHGSALGRRHCSAASSGAEQWQQDMVEKNQ